MVAKKLSHEWGMLLVERDQWFLKKMRLKEQRSQGKMLFH